MKTLKILVAAIFLFSTVLLKAQEWAPAGATWYHTYFYGMQGPVAYLKTQATSNDTTIHGNLCQTLLRIPAGFSSGSKMYMYTDTGKVFIYDRQIDGFHKVYDFDADTSTSWIVTPKWGDKKADSILVKPVYKGQITINGKTFRRDSISFKNIGSSHYFDVFYPGVFEAIEFIGYTGTDLIPWRGSLDDGELITNLRCYTDGNMGHFETGAAPSCEMGISEKAERTSFKLFPNPATESVTLEFGKRPAPETIASITDLTGKAYFKTSIDGLNKSLSLTGLKPGLYLVRIDSPKGTSTEKLVIK